MTNKRTTELIAENGAIYRYVNIGRGKDIEQVKIFCFNEINVKCVYKDLITKRVTLDLSYYFNGQECIINVPRKTLTRREILNTLPQYGCDVTDENVKDVLEWLLFREQEAKIINQHTEIGWNVIDRELVYLLDNVISSKGDIVSRYVGDLKIQAKGSRNEHLALLNKEVRGRYPLELAYCIGLSGILTSYLKDHLTMAVGFFHFYGMSSSGKSTAAFLASSPYGKPAKTRDGLVITWGATDNGIESFMKKKSGFVFIIDETSLRTNYNYTRMIYLLGDGITKNRSTVEGDLRPRYSWSGQIISTGENSILDDANYNTGLKVRVLELGFEAWTESSENSKNIQRGILQHYGHTARDIVKYVLDAGKEELNARYDKAYNFVLNRFKVTDNYTERSAEKISVVYLTGIIANEVLGLNFDPIKALDIMIEAEMRLMPQRDIAVEAYEFIMDKVSSEQGSFFKWELSESYMKEYPYRVSTAVPKTIKGRIDSSEGLPQVVYIQKTILDKMLREANFASTTVVIKAMKQSGFLYTDAGDKNQVKRKLYRDAPSPSNVYGFKVQGNDTEKLMSTDEELRKPVVRLNKVVRKRLHTGIQDVNQLFEDGSLENGTSIDG